MKANGSATGGQLHCRLALALLGGASLLAITAPASAQTQSATASSDQDIVVTGTMLSDRRSIETKREEEHISDSASADEIGSLPDFGLGEALERIPGVAVQLNNQRGEAQFATLRGLNSDYTLIVRDGVSLPTTETSRRQTSLDILPSTIATKITVTKSLTADMDANAIGGQINFRTPSAFDCSRPTLSIRGDLGYYTDAPKVHAKSPSGRLDALYATRFGPGDRFGLVVSGSYFRRVSTTIDSSTLGYDYFDANGKSVAATSPDVGDATPAPQRREQFYYENQRQRIGGFAKLEYDDGTLAAHLSGGYFTHRNYEYHYDDYIYRSSYTNVTSTSGTTAKGIGQASFDLYDQKRAIGYVDGGASLKLSDVDVLTVNADYGVGRYRQDDPIHTVYTSGTASTDFGFNYTYGGAGDYLQVAPVNQAAVDNPNLYHQTSFGSNSLINVEKVQNYSLDFGHNAKGGDRGFGFKVGGKARLLNRYYDYTENYYQPVSSASAASLATAILDQTFSPYNAPGQNYKLIDPEAALAYFNSHQSDYKLASNHDAQNIASDYNLSENIYAAYAMAMFRTDRLDINAGVRWERTDLRTSSPTASTVSGATVYEWQQFRHSYDRVLPSMNASYDITRHFKARFAFSEALGRPNYDDVGQALAITESGANITIKGGNPNLKPRESKNYDLSFEWYGDRNTLVSVGLFRKDIKNEIFDTIVQQAITDENGNAGIEKITRPENLDHASISGLEFNVTKSSFNFLPSPLNRFGISANATLLATSNTSVLMNDGTYRRLPFLVEEAPKTGNVAITYHYRKFDAQLAYNHTDKILYTVAVDNVPNDRYLGAINVFDAQMGWRVGRETSIILKAKNITNNQPTRLMGPDQNLIKDVLETGRAFFVGFAWKG